MNKTWIKHSSYREYSVVSCHPPPQTATEGWGFNSPVIVVVSVIPVFDCGLKRFISTRKFAIGWFSFGSSALVAVDGQLCQWLTNLQILFLFLRSSNYFVCLGSLRFLNKNKYYWSLTIKNCVEITGQVNK